MSPAFFFAIASLCRANSRYKKAKHPKSTPLPTKNKIAKYPKSTPRYMNKQTPPPIRHKNSEVPKKYSAFLEKGWGLGKGKTSFLVKRSFSLPQEHTPLYRQMRRIWGKRMTSRMDSAPVRAITRRSIPTPMPPAGGIPYSRAVRKSSSILLETSSPSSLFFSN